MSRFPISYFQSAISHPMTPVPSKPVASKLLPAQRQAIKMAKMRRSLSVDKGLGSISQPLPAPVDRLFYVRGNTQVSSPACNPRIPPLLREASLVVLGPGPLAPWAPPVVLGPGPLALGPGPCTAGSGPSTPTPTRMRMRTTSSPR